MDILSIQIGEARFRALLRPDLAPETCRWFQSLLPWSRQLIHARWSGEACWVPLGDMPLGLGLENATAFPAPGQLLFYPGGRSETEILLPYGAAIFRSKAGQLAGTPFLTIVNGLDQLERIGRDVLWNGSRGIVFTLGPQEVSPGVELVEPAVGLSSSRLGGG